MVFSKLIGAVRGSARDGAGICLGLYRVMLPLIVILKIMGEFDLIRYLALPLAPVMTLMGLPEDLGIAWAVSMAINLYSGLIVLASMIPSMDALSVAQTSTFSLIVLYAHSLPVECRIAQQCGLSLVFQLAFRVGAAILAGVALHLFFSRTGIFAEPALILFPGDSAAPTLSQWAWSQVINLVCIYCIITVLLLAQKAIDHYNIVRWLELPLLPLVKMVGVSRKAASTILVGMSMGLIYGSGLIIQAARDGRLSRRDIFGAISLMGLAHAIIEDTFLLMVIGAHWTVVLAARLVIATALTAAVMRVWLRSHPVAMDTQ
ncbi:putative Membrane protein [uncultured delta proteobacterium]|uniref:Putative Membrane protein n=1 Tax=uncultured delta proteobacterium TaxID=34034 RepID=A0A212JG51_9DELT|nr:putative Membrane protein [uncultured delta proteobacterium]